MFKLSHLFFIVQAVLLRGSVHAILCWVIQVCGVKKRSTKKFKVIQEPKRKIRNMIIGLIIFVDPYLCLLINSLRSFYHLLHISWFDFTHEKHARVWQNIFVFVTHQAYWLIYKQTSKFLNLDSSAIHIYITSNFINSTIDFKFNSEPKFSTKILLLNSSFNKILKFKFYSISNFIYLRQLRHSER